MDAAQLGDLSQILLKRSMTGSLQHTNTTDSERALLASLTPPITGQYAQNYAAWRRAVLWVSGIVLLIGLLLAFAERQGVAEALAQADIKAKGLHPDGAEFQALVARATAGLGKANAELLDNLQDFQLFVNMAVVVLVLLAARGWSRVTRSRNLARWAWVASLFLPLVVAAVPWVNSMDFKHLDEVTQNAFQQFGANNAQAEKASEVVKRGIAGLLALSYFILLAPKLLSIFPGIMRSALTMKTLFPESMQTGWMTVLVAPLFVGFLLLGLCVLSQVQGNFLLVGAFACLAIGPCVYLLRARDLLRPHPVEDVERIVHQIRRRAVAFNLTGVVLLVIYVIDHHTLSLVTLSHMLLEALGSILLTMVVFSDLLLALLRFELRQSAAFAGSDLQKSYEARLAELDQTGLTDIEAALRLRDKAAAPSA